MANNGISAALPTILSAIESVREELVGLRADLAGPSASVSSAAAAPVAAAARENPWASLTPNQLAKKIANMSASTKTKMKSALRVSPVARAPSDWLLFADRVRSLLRSAGYNNKSLGMEAQQFASSLKEEEPDFSAWSDEEILARRAAWSPPEVTKAPGKSWAKLGSPTAVEAAWSPPTVGKGWVKARKNPWEGLNEGQKAERIAKMKEGRAVKKAAGESAPAAPAASASPSMNGFQSVMLSGNRYLVNLATGHAYHRLSDGGQGEWAGIFHRTGGLKGAYINASVPEPNGVAGGTRKQKRKDKRKQKKTRKH